MKNKILTRFEDLPKTYRELVNEFYMPRPIHDKVGYENAVEAVDALAGHHLNKEQEDYLDAVSTFIENYEKEQSAFGGFELKGIEALKYLLEENEMKAQDLSEILGCEKSMGSKILNGERRLTTEHIQALCKRFKVYAELFL